MVDETQDEITLADLAGFDLSEVQELRSESLPAGVYEFEGVEAKLTEGTNKETNARQYVAEFKFKVVEAKAVTERGVDKDSLIGKHHTEKRYIVPGEKTAEQLGYLRGFIADLGLESGGALGGDGATVGVIDSVVGHFFTGKIVKQRDRNDPTRHYARLQLEPKKNK